MKISRNPRTATQNINPGDRFNVLKKDVSFYLVIDASNLKMFFYGIDNKNWWKSIKELY